MNLSENICTLATCTCSKLHVNRPRYSKPCEGGVDCPNANCYFTHPEEREFPTLIYTFCKFGAKCGRSSCKFLHPERHTQVQHVEKKVKKCRWRSNCPEQEGNCELLGHDEPAPICRFGIACRNKDNKKDPCMWSHVKKQQICPHGEDCRRADKCWYAFHTTEQILELQEALAKLIVAPTPAPKPEVNDDL
jgi:hypothetical protein